jgi:hypothetical protein
MSSPIWNPVIRAGKIAPDVQVLEQFVEKKAQNCIFAPAF